MDRARRERRMVAARWLTRGFHSGRISRQLGAHLAAFLIALPLFAADDIAFDPRITEAEFAKFSRLLVFKLRQSFQRARHIVVRLGNAHPESTSDFPVWCTGFSQFQRLDAPVLSRL